MEVSVKKILEPDETELVIELLSRNSVLEYIKARDFFVFYLNETPAMTHILVKRGLTVIGYQCLLSRTISLDGIELSTVGMSFMVIEPESVNSNVARLLKKSMFEEINGADVSIGFARKALDNYWYLYGYLGITNFGSISIEGKDISARASMLFMEEFSVKDLPEAFRIFKASQGVQTGGFFRDEILFDYSFRRSIKAGAKWMSIRDPQSFIGYLVYRDDKIIELYTDASVKSKALMALLKKEMTYSSKIEFDIGFSHPFIRDLSELHHSRDQRFAWRGGHIAKITHPLALLEKMKDRLVTRINAYGVLPFSLQVNNILFEYDGVDIKVVEREPKDQADIRFKEIYWAHLIFGVDSPRFYVKNGSDKITFLDILFPVLWPQFPELDQF